MVTVIMLRCSGFSFLLLLLLLLLLFFFVVVVYSFAFLNSFNKLLIKIGTLTLRASLNKERYSSASTFTVICSLNVAY